MKEALQPIGISKQEIYEEADKYADDWLNYIMFNNEYLYENSVLGALQLNAQIHLNRHNAIDFTGFLTVKNLNDVLTEIELGLIDELVVDPTDAIKYEIRNEIRVINNQVKELGDYVYLIHKEYGRKLIMEDMDELLDAHIGVNINVYKDQVNNDIFMSRVYARFNRIKAINNTYEESRVSIDIIKESIREETEKEIHREAIEEYRRIFGYPPWELNQWQPSLQS